jgi:hypothetical protein
VRDNGFVRSRFTHPLLIAPVMLCAMLLVAALLTACIDDDDPDNTAPAPPPGEEFGAVDTQIAQGDVPTSIGGNELTPAIDPCGQGVPPVAVTVGVRQTVVGDVVNARKVAGPGEPVTLLEMGEQGGNVPFAIAIPDSALGAFAEDPVELYRGSEVCVNGVVQEFEGTPVIFVAGDSEIVKPQR